MDVKEHLKALRDQIRVRLNVYGAARKKLPCIGDDSGMAAATRLEEELRMAVVEPLPPKPHLASAARAVTCSSTARSTQCACCVS